MSQKTTYTGSCLCGVVRFRLRGKLDGVWFCHCTQCRKNYGLYGAFVGVPRHLFSLTNSSFVRWYQSSSQTKRGFCKKCGSPIAWDRKTSTMIYVLPGLINGNVRMKRGKHIFTADKGGYYQIGDTLPQYKVAPHEVQDEKY